MPVASKLAHQHQAMLMNQQAKSISRKALFSKEGGLGEVQSSQSSTTLPPSLRSENAMRVPVSIKSKSTKLTALRGVRSLGNDAAVSSDTTVLSSEPQVEVEQEVYEVTTEPLVTEGQAAVVENFAASSTDVTAPSKSFVDQVLEFLANAASEASKDYEEKVFTSVLENSEKIVSNAVVFFKQRFLKECSIRTIGDNKTLDVNLSVDIDTRLAQLATSADASSVIKRQPIGAIHIAEFVGLSRGVPATVRYITERSIADAVVVNSSTFQGTSDLVEASSNSLLCAIGAHLLGHEVSIFTSGSDIFTAGSRVNLDYRSSVFFGAAAVNSIAKSKDGKFALDAFVKLYSQEVAPVISCKDKVAESLDALDTDNDVEVKDPILLIDLINLESPVAVIERSRVDAALSDELSEKVKVSLRDGLLISLKMYAMGAQAQLVSLGDIASKAVSALRPLASIIPDLSGLAPKFEKLQAQVAEKAETVAAIALESDSVTEGFMSFLSDPVQFIIATEEKRQSDAIVSEIIANVYKAASGTPLSEETGYGTVLQYVAKPEFKESVRNEVVSVLEDVVAEIDAADQGLQKDTKELDTVSNDIVKVAENAAKSSTSEQKGAIEGATKAVDAVAETAKTIAGNAANLRARSRDNLKNALAAGRSVSLSAMGTGTKVAIGAAVGALLFFGARSILKKK